MTNLKIGHTKDIDECYFHSASSSEYPKDLWAICKEGEHVHNQNLLSLEPSEEQGKFNITLTRNYMLKVCRLRWKCGKSKKIKNQVSFENIEISATKPIKVYKSLIDDGFDYYVSFG